MIQPLGVAKITQCKNMRQGLNHGDFSAVVETTVIVSSPKTAAQTPRGNSFFKSVIANDRPRSKPAIARHFLKFALPPK
jgi:hypothetical protein